MLCFALFILLLQQTDPGSDQDVAPTSAWELLVSRYDSDKNGVISREEYTHNDEHWASLDTNGDGKLSEADVAKLGQQRQRRSSRGSSAKPPGRNLKAPLVGDIAPDFELPVLVRDPVLRFEVEGLEPFLATVEGAGPALDHLGNPAVHVWFDLAEIEFRQFTKAAIGKEMQVFHGDKLLSTAIVQSALPGKVLITVDQPSGFTSGQAALLAGQLSGTPVKLSDFRGDKPVALIFGSYT
jgi:hypothetical protein